MVKHKLNSGFILIELIVVLTILSFTILINLQISNAAFKVDVYLKEIDILKGQLNIAKQKAINSQELVYISFKDNNFKVTQENSYYNYSFKSIKFQNSKELYFNKKGNLNQGYTIIFKHGYKSYHLIFYIGKGWYKIE